MQGIFLLGSKTSGGHVAVNFLVSINFRILPVSCFLIGFFLTMWFFHFFSFFFLGGEGGAVFLKKNNTFTSSPSSISIPNPNTIPRPTCNPPLLFCYSVLTWIWTPDPRLWGPFSSPLCHTSNRCKFGPRLTLSLWHKLTWFENFNPVWKIWTS